MSDEKMHGTKKDLVKSESEPDQEYENKAQAVASISVPREEDEKAKTFDVEPITREDSDPNVTDVNVELIKKLIRQHLNSAQLPDLTYTWEGYDETIPMRVTERAHRRVEEGSSAAAYIDHLEKTVTSLQRRLRGDFEPVTNDIPRYDTPQGDIPQGDIPQVGSSGTVDDQQQTDEVPVAVCEVAIKRWIEFQEDYGPSRVVDDASSLDDLQKSEIGTDCVLNRFKEYSKEKQHIATRLEITSSLLIGILQKIVKRFPNNGYKSLFARKVSIVEPYMMLFHHRKALVEELDSLNEEEPRAHLSLLLDFMRSELPTVSRTLDSIEDGTVEEIDYDELWLLYPPGSLLCAMEDAEWRAYRTASLEGFERNVRNFEGHVPDLKVVCLFTELDEKGCDLKVTSTSITMSRFFGSRMIQDLEFIPANYVLDGAKIKEALLQRGEKYWGYRGKGHFQAYVGDAWLTATIGDGLRVVVDYSTSSRYVDEPDPDDDISPRYHHHNAEEECDCSRCKKSRSQPFASVYDQFTEQKAEGINTFTQSFDSIFAGRLLCCPSKVMAFSLRDKTWAMVKISELGPVKFREDSFAKLVIKKKHKDVVMAMVKSYLNQDSKSGDLIQGKGQGLVVLLHGAPGTGKTLTAECVAEREKIPLCMVTCGDLGTRPDVLEDKLREVFAYAVNWNAVLLLDEADVFLQERDVHDLERNALVSVFLRQLEYFDGVLFLTTNRPGLLDEAFQSRIHITLGLPELDEKAQLQVWRIFVKELETEKSVKLRILEYVSDDIKKNGSLNGRQIRNCIRTAQAIAAQADEGINEKHIKNVLGIGREFTAYLDRVNRQNREQRAAALGHRVLVAN